MFVNKKYPVNSVGVEEANSQFPQLPSEQFEETRQYGIDSQSWVQSLHSQDNSNNTDILLQDQDNLPEEVDDWENIDSEILEQCIKDIVCHLQTNLTTEMQLCQTYRYLIQVIINPKIRNTLLDLLNYEISHPERFVKSLNSPGQLMMNKFSDNIIPQEIDETNFNSKNSYKNSCTLEIDETLHCNFRPEFSCFIHSTASKSK